MATKLARASRLTQRATNPVKRRSVPANPLLAALRSLILQARESVARAVNSGLVLLYWQIGTRIRQDILKEKRAEYGERIVHALSAQLTAEFGRGFTARNLFYMVRFAEAFPDIGIVNALRAQLGWTHFRQIISLEDPLKRDFYAEMCRLENWSTRTLSKKIDGMLFERTALSRKPAKLAAMELQQLREEDKLTPDLVFRDPYFLLSWLKRHECEPDEAEPLGLILCAGKSEEHVELLEPGDWVARRQKSRRARNRREGAPSAGRPWVPSSRRSWRSR